MTSLVYPIGSPPVRSWLAAALALLIFSLPTAASEPEAVIITAAHDICKQLTDTRNTPSVKQPAAGTTTFTICLGNKGFTRRCRPAAKPNFLVSCTVDSRLSAIDVTLTSYAERHTDNRTLCETALSELISKRQPFIDDLANGHHWELRFNADRPGLSLASCPLYY